MSDEHPKAKCYIYDVDLVVTLDCDLQGHDKCQGLADFFATEWPQGMRIFEALTSWRIP